MTDTYLFANNAASVLASTATLIATTMTVTTGHGARFPSPGADQAFILTVQDGAAFEIVACTSRTGDVLTVTRGLDGTVAQTWSPGASVDIRIPNIILDAFAQKSASLASTGGTMTGPLLLDDSVSTAVPVLAFDSDTNTGIGHPAADTITVSTNAVERLRISNVALTATLPYLADYGSVAAPGLSFAGDPDTGFYRSGANSIGIALNGAQYYNFSPTVATFLTPLAVSGDVTVVGDVAIDGALGVTTSIIAGVFIRSTTYLHAMTYVLAEHYVQAVTYMDAGTYVEAGTHISAGTYIEMGTPGTSGNRAVAFSQFTATLGTTGTAILPNGKIEKWGTGSTSAGSGSVAFAAAFPTACDNVQLTVNGGTVPVNLHPLVVGTKTAAGFAVFGGIGETVGFDWRAIGR